MVTDRSVDGGGALAGAGSSCVAMATRDRILQRCSNDAFTRYSTTSSSMMIGRENTDGFGRIGTTTSFDGGGGTGVSGRGGLMR